ncbi:MAG TPA: glycosyltransferase family 2 protein, partial [bacterium]|nr:glycosyltransferase family 2 protein [bacterium]
MDSSLSVVIACYDERENLRPLLSRLLPVLRGITSRYEVIFVDDGSTDGSVELLEEARAEDPRIRVVVLSRNFGQQAAFAAGLKHARGDAVVLMDGDLQDPPELLPEMVARWKEGNEVVYAVRRTRDEAGWKRASYAAFY